jgi:hypothetical protein
VCVDRRQGRRRRARHAGELAGLDRDQGDTAGRGAPQRPAPQHPVHAIDQHLRLVGLASEAREIAGEIRHARVALPGVLGQAALDHRRQLARRGDHRRRWVDRDHHAHLREALGPERQVALDRLVQHRAERPDVGPRVDMTRRAHLLGRHVRRAAEQRPGLGERQLGSRRRLRDPEVEDLEQHAAVGARRQEQVGRLDVAVHDAERVRLGERLAGLDHQVDREARLQPALLGDQLADVLALEELHHEVRLAVAEPPDVDDPGDVLALELGGGLSLPDEPGDGLIGDRDVVAQHLDRDLLVEPEVPGLDDQAHPAAPDHGVHAVLPEQDCPAFYRSHRAYRGH